LEVLKVELGKRKFQSIIKELEESMKIDNDFINSIIDKMKRLDNTHNIDSF